MKITSAVEKLGNMKTPALVKFCYQRDYRRDPALRELDRSVNGALDRIFRAGEFSGKLNQTAVLYPAHGPERLILAGVGPKKDATDDRFRQAAGTLSVLTAAKKSVEVAFLLDGDEDRRTVQAVIEGFMLGSFRIGEYKSEIDDNRSLTETLLFYTGTATHTRKIEPALERGRVISEGVLLARRLASDPANSLTPEKFAKKAVELAKEFAFDCRVLNEKQIRTERMGALLSVAQGSQQPPRFVILEYSGGRPGTRPVVLVGKGITFDSGGLSLKSAANMIEMKGDMTGGAIVLATLATAARLNLKQNLVGLIPLAENMPSGTATRPGDIVTSRKGKTIEIINTDAEGRLILADALDYANEFKPRAVIDIATLTGASLYILGYEAAPILGNNERLLGQIAEASERTAEKVWRLPLWDAYRKAMKSSIADLKNSGGRAAGTITAAAFLENFIGDWPWGHIDIAYVDVEPEGRPYIPKGATGIGLRLLIELLQHWKKV